MFHRSAFCLTGLLAIFSALIAAEPPGEATRGAVVPVEDLKQQTAFFFERLDESLADPKKYGLAKHARVKKDAATLAILIAGRSEAGELPADKANEASQIAMAMVARATKYAEVAKERAALGAVLDAPAASNTAGSIKIEWPDFEMGQFMKQMEFVDNRLKQTVDDADAFQRGKASAVGYTATLWAMAADMEAVPAKVDPEKWRKLSTAMRVAASETNAKAHAGDLAATREAFRKLAGTCNRCHDDYRRQAPRR
jgi:hypothetical protein